MKSIEEGLRELVVAGRDGAVGLEMADHALDAVALAVETLVPSDRGLAVGSRWDDGTDAIVAQALADGVAVVALVGEEVGGARFGERHHRFERRAVRRLAAGEVEGEGQASGIAETMNFTGEPAPRAAKSLLASPPFAPAACGWPRTVVESML